MIENEIKKAVSSKLETVAIDELKKNLETQLQEFQNKDNQTQIICNKINKLMAELISAERFSVRKEKLSIRTTSISLTKDFIRKNNIYKKFFEIQNLINFYLGQQILITQVIKNDTGREVYISKNTDRYIIDHEKYKNKFMYSNEAHGQKLLSGMDNAELKILQAVANEVEERYDNHPLGKYKGHLIMWYVKEWKKVRLYTKGPINEAFVNFYIHAKALEGANAEWKIDDFIMNKNFGMIKADNAPGFILGDVNLGGLQFAVKGADGTPQGMTQVLKEWYALMKANEGQMNEVQLSQFIKQYQEKTETASQVKSVVDDEIEAAIDIAGFEDFLESLYD